MKAFYLLAASCAVVVSAKTSLAKEPNSRLDSPENLKTLEKIPPIQPLSNPTMLNPIQTGYIWPTNGVITSGFGRRWGRMHKGIDIAAPTGTPIVAAASGVVVYAHWNTGGYGNLIKIQHPDGSMTLYAHNNHIVVHEGEYVEQGQLIGEVGSTGHSTGPHCHFEIHPAGQGAVNPIAYLVDYRKNF